MNLGFAGAERLIEDPNDSQVFYLFGSKNLGGTYQMMIWKSTDAGATWIPIPVGDPFAYAGCFFAEIAPSDSSIWYMGGYVNNGSAYVPMIYRSNNAGVTWSDVTGDLPNYGYTFWVSPDDPDYILQAGYNSGYYSTNGGANWTEIPDLATEYARDLIYHDGVLYLATYYNGVKVSYDQGLTWTYHNDGLPASASIQKFALDPRGGWLYAATYGVGFCRCPVTPVPLWGEYHEISQVTGGSVELALDAGVANAGRYYMILAGVSGTDPGTVLPGGYETLPLNWDALTDVVYDNINTPTFANFLGTLDGDGRADATLVSPHLPPSSIGVHVHFAYCCNNLFDYVSNPIEIVIVD